MRVIGALAVLFATACGTSTTAVPSSPSPVPVAATPSQTATPIPSPKLEIPMLLLDVRAGADQRQPGTIPPSPGGSLTRGPETHTVDEAGMLWLFDQAKSRVIAYANSSFVRALAVPDVPRGAGGMLVSGGKLYFRIVDDHGRAYSELELDATNGKVLRRADVHTGAASIYPFERVVLGWIPSGQKGVDDELGHDGLGNRYVRHYFAQWTAGQCFSVIRRITPSGQDVAEACFDVGSAARDYFVARDGAVYQLEQLYTGAELDRFVVTRVISPAK